MIVLDTNVLSAMMQREPESRIVGWLDDQPIESLWTTTISIFEVRCGLELLPKSRRRDQLEKAFEQAILADLDGRVLSFDTAAARIAAHLAAERHGQGKSIDFRDVEIAGIVAARRACLATRNTRHFHDLGIDLIDPWHT